MRTNIRRHALARSHRALAIFLLGACLIARIDSAQAQLSNLSTRTLVGTGDAVAVNEFVVGGTGSATVLVRGLGPSTGLPGLLPDPTLVLADDSGNVIASNDGWKETQQTEIAATGLAPLDDVEAAILATLSPGTYVVIERGKNSTTGVGLNEVYNLTPAGGTAFIKAVGSRGQVEAGANSALVMGLIVSSQQDLLARALGPSIGVAADLADPTLSVFDGMGNSFAQNDDWQTGGQKTEIQNSGLAPTDGAEAAVIATFPAGNSTVLGGGKSGASGIVFNQIYVLPYSGPAIDPIPPLPTPTPTPSAASPRLLNISTRLKVLTVDKVLIGGFIVTGTQPKKVILRAIGPSLGTANPPVPGALVDPILELHESDGTVITNDNWRDTQEAEIIASTVPPTNDLESAIVATLNPGAYTAIVSGKNGGTGIGLVEAYDLDQAADSQLANISTRGFVEAGDNVMIGGFIVGSGTGSANVIVRAIGPSLGNANPPVPGALADTTLELHDSNGTTLASNDNWKDTQEAEIIATTVPPTDDLESAIVMTLAPGAYTAIVAGKNNTTGVGLVEAYNLQ